MLFLNGVMLHKLLQQTIQGADKENVRWKKERKKEEREREEKNYFLAKEADPELSV